MGVRERADANRTREPGHLDEIQGSIASSLKLPRNGAVGFIDWLGVPSSPSPRPLPEEDLACSANMARSKLLLAARRRLWTVSVQTIALARSFENTFGLDSRPDPRDQGTLLIRIERERPRDCVRRSGLPRE
jgi:hypothetical protein